ncbi:pseudouridine synthase [Pontibacter sp. E15-1]|uniref:pseudouridine synthase n=1 Tax=Pontibacter sp. E15-1 TaxID=2919918 RepID=UPI001F501BE6|nr:pseudouridine synthase [Pontibacter sp. E15-1]MCJ8167326.1 pseudouridine synthase [Pontibacter sp. E15-1]
MHRHFILFKPYGYVSQFVSETKKKRVLGELHDFPEGTMAIGRLDEASEGLLLLTTDGKASELVRSSKVEKEYYAQVDGLITEEAIRQLRTGIEIRTEKELHLTRPCAVQKLEATPELPERARRIRDERHGPSSWISITLTEGKFRQVRKMTAAVGFPTLRLVRARIGNITVVGMAAGETLEVERLDLGLPAETHLHMPR